MHNKLVNELWQDPLLYTYFDNIPDRLLFDCGYMFGLSLRDIQRISSVFVSHTHFDHFMGFDHLLRMCIELPIKIELFGPRGFIGNVRAKLGGYSWNLCDSLELEFVVNEISENCVKSVTLPAVNSFIPAEPEKTSPFSKVIKATDIYRVECAVLNHKIPSLAFSVIENDFLKVNKASLEEMGLKGGPWLGTLRKEILDGNISDGTYEIPGHGTFAKKLLFSSLFEIKKGRKVSYVVDTVFSPETQKKIIELAHCSDDFYCECAFLDVDSDKAQCNHHLTARQAGILAREAEVKRLFPIHFSKRYNERWQELCDEARTEFPQVICQTKKISY